MSDDCLLRGALEDAADTRRVVIGAGSLAAVAEVFRQSFGDRSAAIIADENTFDVAGREVQRQFSAACPSPIKPFIFPGLPPLHAGYEHVGECRSAEYSEVPRRGSLTPKADRRA